MQASSAPRNPVPTVDIIIEVGAGAERKIVLIDRKNPPHGWALPGGFVDYGETAAAAARREAAEETSLAVDLTELFHVYADPRRDARLHTISTVFIARPVSDAAGLRGADDAARAALFARDALPGQIAFDHRRILRDYFHYLDTGERPPPDR